jgi:hypothetical protein
VDRVRTLGTVTLVAVGGGRLLTVVNSGFGAQLEGGDTSASWLPYVLAGAVATAYVAAVSRLLPRPSAATSEGSRSRTRMDPALEPDTTRDGIFISYRRDDVPYLALAIYDRIEKAFGPDRTFIDVGSIRPGEDWEGSLEDALRRTGILVAVIGNRWLQADDKSPNRLEEPNDWVRREIEAALERGVRLLPVLADGALLPATHELPGSLHGLARRQAFEIKQSTSGSDMGHLLAAIERILAEQATQGSGDISPFRGDSS